MSAAAKFHWDHSRLVPAPTAHRLRLGERPTLFCNRRQQLYELNPTADAIWLALETLAPHDAAQVLAAGGADPERMLGYVREAARAWMSHGLLAPQEIEALTKGAPDGELHLAFDELKVRIRTFGGLSIDPVREVFGQFAAAPGKGLDIIAAQLGELIFLYEDGQLLGAFDERTWVPHLKGLQTDRYAHAVTGAFLAHAALLSKGGKGLLICGQPAAGKSTLTVALMSAGFGYHADDVVRIDGAARARGVPFSPALKTGSWPLLKNRLPGLDQLPVYMRADGQEVRYLPAAGPAAEDLKIAAVVLLARQAEGEARIEPVEPLETLSTILGSAFSARGAIEPPTLKALAEVLNTARNGRLIYSGLDGAVAALEALLA